MAIWDITIQVEVTDERALKRAAHKHLLAGGMSVTESQELLRFADAGVCLRYILDPNSSPDGCEVILSEAAFVGDPCTMEGWS